MKTKLYGILVIVSFYVNYGRIAPKIKNFIYGNYLLQFSRQKGQTCKNCVLLVFNMGKVHSTFALI